MECDCNYTKYVWLKNSISIIFSPVITTFQGRNRIYEQKNSSSLKTVFREQFAEAE